MININKTIQELSESFLDSIRIIVREELSKSQTEQLPSSSTDEVLSIQQAADFLKIKKQTLYGLVSKRGIPFSKPGKNVLFFRKDLIEWLYSHKRFSNSEISKIAQEEFISTKHI